MKTATPLEKVTVVDFVQKRGSLGNSQVPGSECWHCGSAIINCVVIEDEEGERHDIGTTCAERVGLDLAGLKQMLRERDQRERWEQSKQIERETEEKLAAKYGDHGTFSRFESGCFCEDCRKTAPHGTTTQYNDGCTCIECCEAMVQWEDPNGRVSYGVWERPVIVEIATGTIVEAKMVDATYGLAWLIKSGDNVTWLTPGAKRRSTQAKKGYVEAEAIYLVKTVYSRRYNQSFYFNEVLLASPIIDAYGEKINHAA